MIKIVLFLIVVFFTLEAHQLRENYLYLDYNKTEAVLHTKFEIETRLFEKNYPFLDENQNGIISHKELRHHQKQLLHYFITHFSFFINHLPLSFDDADITFHRYQDQTYMQIDKKFFYKEIRSETLVNHLFFEYEKKHRMLVHITQKQGEYILTDKQQEITIVLQPQTQYMRLQTFIGEGVKHILDGIDHLAFVLMLLVSIIALRKSIFDLIRIISTFSLAHSMTLFIAGFGLFIPNVKFIESFIALSILYVALLNFFKSYKHVNYGVVFGFGLVHGFGFANVLQIADLGNTFSFVVALLGFNLGVEFGQLGVIALIFPFLYLLRFSHYEVLFLRLLSISVAIVASYWLYERIFLV